jgi:hypothetical protein
VSHKKTKGIPAAPGGAALLMHAAAPPCHLVRTQSDDNDGLFFLFDLIRGDVFLLSGGLPEIPDRFAHPAADFGQFTSPENDQNNDQDNNHFLHSDTKHGVSFTP